MPGLPQPGGGQRDQSKFIVFENFEKMNTQGARQGLSEKELAWLENLQMIAPNKLLTVSAPAAAALATITGTSSRIFYADINGTDYFIVFTAAGSGYGVNIATGATNHFAPDGTFSATPDCTTWEASRVLIMDSVAGYCTWDGSIFVQEGGVSPNINVTASGNYGVAPTVTISGGSGSGATAHAVLSGNSVSQVILDNPGTGYQAADTLTVSFSSPAGSGATGHVTMTGFPVAALGIASQGLYSAPGNYNLQFTGGGGTGAVGFATVTNSGGSNVVTSVTLQAGGSGYTSPPHCTAPGGVLGNDAVFNVFLGTESVASIVLDTGGTGYLAPPVVSITGGGGSGATAHATLSGTSVNALILDTPGANYTSTPAVAIGAGSSASASARVWPFIPKGTTLAVFQGRVWFGIGQTLAWTGTGASTGGVGYDDENPSDGAGVLALSDADLVHAIYGLRAINNYLNIFGDNSIKQIGNITFSSGATLFTILTLSSDQGTIYPKSIISYNRVTMFANPNGVYGVFGSTVQKLSSDLDGIFALVDFTQEPQAAVVDLNGIHCAAYLLRYKDPAAGTRSIVVIFDGKKWFVGAQGDGLTAIVSTASATADQNELYGSSGSDVTALFSDATIDVVYKLQTALTHHGNAIQGKKAIRSGFTAQLATGTKNVTMAFDTENGSTNQTIVLTAKVQVPHHTIEGSGVFLGMTLTGSAHGLTLTNALAEYQETKAWP